MALQFRDTVCLVRDAHPARTQQANVARALLAGVCGKLVPSLSINYLGTYNP